MAPRTPFTAAAALSFALALGAACSSTSGGPLPGPDSPGQPCTEASECGCWQCLCTGVGGAPGAAQLCVSGTCPTGEAACTPICALADAPLASAVSVDSCDGRP